MYVPKLRSALGLATSAVVLGLIGCETGPKQSENPPREEDIEALFGPGAVDRDPGEAPDAAAVAAQSSGWSIVLEQFGGENHEARARNRAAAVAQLLRRNDVRVRRGAGTSAVVVGQYRDPEDASARRDLNEIRAIDLNGSRPFRSAFFGPAAAVHEPMLAPKYDLSRAKDEFGADALYTLQIAVYEADDRALAKREAEQVAIRLREQGEMAFFWHGPRRSMVTVGIFGSFDFDPRTGFMSPELEALQEKYPHNVLNGQYGISEQRGDEEVLQKSALVEIP